MYERQGEEEEEKEEENKPGRKKIKNPGLT
jgi:hypothetical protein